MQESDVFKIIESYFDKYTIADDHLDSFNKLILDDLPRIVQNESGIKIKLKSNKFIQLFFGYLTVDYPHYYKNQTKMMLYPCDARRKGVTYESNVKVDISAILLDDGVELNRFFYPKVILCKIPVMVGSIRCNTRFKHPAKIQECLNDPKGYYIISGNDRVLITQERNGYNQPRLIKGIVELRSCNSAGINYKHTVSIQNNRVYCKFPYIKSLIRIEKYLSVFGITHETVPELEKGEFDGARDFLIKAIVKQREKKIQNKDAYLDMILNTIILGHVPFEHKGGYLLYLMEKLKHGSEDTLDHLSNKRYEMDGELIGDLFRTLLNKNLMEKFSSHLNSNTEQIDITAAISKMNIGKTIGKCFSLGTWGTHTTSSKFNVKFQGVSQIIKRNNFTSFLSDLKRVIIKKADTQIGFDMRQLHPSHFGMIDPCDSPDGKQIGVNKNFTVLTKITTGVDFSFVKSILPIPEEGNYRVFLNGRFLFTTSLSFLENFKNVRTLHRLENKISVGYEKMEIWIWSDRGRVTRPFFTTLDFKFESWKELIDNRTIVYLDSNEIQNSTVGMYSFENKYEPVKICEYYEIHPGVLHSVTMGVIPFFHHNPAPRNCYETNMTKQAIGTCDLNHAYRYDTQSYRLNYGQRPICSTLISRCLKQTEMPFGVNAIVAIMTCDYNQEDAVVVNKSAIERGLFNSTLYKTETIREDKMKTYEFDEVLPPESKHLRYRNCQSGLIDKGSKVSIGDCLLSKKSYSIKVKNIEIESSLFAKKEHEGIVDDSFRDISLEGKNVYQIKLRRTIQPEIGDKLASTSCQKGTIGMIMPQEDMPFSCQTGTVPDIIIAPYAIPSRMTVGMLVDMIAGKVGLLNGEFRDATSFSNNSADPFPELIARLKASGYEKHGNETMINGTTGQMMDAQIMIGPAYYQQLSNLVHKKIHARVDGGVQIMTMQPSVGRRNQGGLKSGEMECENFEAYGLAEFLRERLFDLSDPFELEICQACGIVVHDVCPKCKGENDSKTIVLPYASKLLFQDLLAMNIHLKLRSTD